MPVGFDEEDGFRVADEGGGRVDPHGERHAVLVGHRVVARRRLTRRLVETERAGGRVEENPGGREVLGRELAGRLVEQVTALQVHHRVADPRRLAPAVLDALEVVVEEAQQVVLARLLVVVRPFHVVVDAQPLFVGGHGAPAAERAGRVDRVGVARDDVGGHADALEGRDLRLPERVEQRVRLELGHQVLALVVADEGRRDLPRERQVRDAAARDEVAVDVAEAFPRCDRRQMGRLLGGGEPLHDGEIGVAGRADLAVAPVAHAEPLDQVVEVLAFPAAPPARVTLRMVGAARVRVADRVALRAPEAGIGALELHQAGQLAWVHAEQPEQLDVLRGVAAALAVGAPGDEHGHLLGAGRAEHVDIDGDAVAQGDGHVLFQDHVDRQLLVRGLGLEAGRERARAGLERAEDTLSTFRVAVGRHQNAEIVTHRTFPMSSAPFGAFDSVAGSNPSCRARLWRVGPRRANGGGPRTGGRRRPHASSGGRACPR